ncbi:hypothetical protein [Kytococcus sedentarius]|uniref:hypothetical protein n=1 Tax=Kytococcus sedentarius TaxID=1276 RepID=UPI0019503C98|nr:hypothetical protein [Kytococcus sedentarius]QRO86740.1 hypothetical protein I6J30_07650 [Kytococcus sedentarius]
MSEQDPYNPEDTETQPDDQGPGTGDTVKEEGRFISPHEAESAQEGVSNDARGTQSEG